MKNNNEFDNDDGKLDENMFGKVNEDEELEDEELEDEELEDEELEDEELDIQTFSDCQLDMCSSCGKCFHVDQLDQYNECPNCSDNNYDDIIDDDDMNDD